GELFEHQMLVLHLGPELRRLEQAFTIPLQTSCRSRHGCDVDNEPVVEKRNCFCLRGPVREQLCSVGEEHTLGMIYEAVMFRMEDRVDRGETDVLVHPAITGYVVRVE